MKQKIDLKILISLIIAIIAGFTLRYLTYESAYINEWITRDFDRAFNLVEGVYFPLAGPEMNNGGRLPGPFLYLLLAIPILIKSSYESVIAFNFIINCISIIGFYFVVKRFFGIYVGLLSTVLLSFNLTHIGAAGFPFNPSYLFLLVPIYLWFTFDLGINKNVKSLPFIILIVSLGIQLHFSFATFYLAPILIIFLIRLKVPLKIIFLSVAIAAICFTPYTIHLKQTINPIIESSGTFENKKTSIIEKAIKFPFVANTIDKMTFKNGLRRAFYFDQRIAAIYFGLTLIGMSFLIWQLFKKEREFRYASKEFILFLIFYGPALIYEIINPVGYSRNPHNWYTFIFIMPQMMIISFFVVTLMQKIKTKWKRSAYIFISISLITTLAYNAYADVNRSSLLLKKDLFFGEFKNYKNLHGTLMQNLELSQEDYLNRVYFEGFNPQSSYALESLKNSNYSAIKTKLIDSTKFKSPVIQPKQFPNSVENNNYCYLIVMKENVDRLKQKGPSDLITRRIYNFLSDKSISIKEQRLISLVKFEKPLFIFKYNSVQNQSCYSNGLNLFVVEKDTRDLLLQSKVLDVKKDLDMKIISKEEDYNSKNELVSFKGKYLIYDNFTNSPFKFTLKITKQNEIYSIYFKIHRYYFWPFQRFITKTEFGICTKHLQTRLNGKDCVLFKIIPVNTLNSTFYSYNPKWEKEIELPQNFKIIKGTHFLKLAFAAQEMSEIDRDGIYSQTLNLNVLTLN
jgi:hypothetical protein